MNLTQHMRILEPAPGILAFYDGRVEGHRFAPEDNWVDDGALLLGIASYAVISGDEALIYDTHVSIPHAQFVRDALLARGITRLRVVLSHWHLDHVAGTAAFSGVEVIANLRTAQHLRRRQAAIEAGTEHGWPPIQPLILPDTTFTGQMRLRVGTRHVTLIEANIHSDDATVLWLPEEGILLAGDTVEDCVTYVAEPADFAGHLTDLDRLTALHPKSVLPCHGDPDVIAAGGYTADLLAATARYIRWLQDLRLHPDRAETPLRAVIAEDVASGTLRYFPRYEAVHHQNVKRTLTLPTAAA
ncbi:MAG: MBL fold metallo-hydrolase [Candidatus Saccharibacteria bacterium]|nr:MBL fold metallo-hydrolase [Pseudorhodobacter sp.]